MWRSLNLAVTSLHKNIYRLVDMKQGYSITTSIFTETGSLLLSNELNSTV